MAHSFRKFRFFHSIEIYLIAFKFESLKVWHLAADLSNQIDLLTKSFPFEERYSLSSQIKRAADSVALNIAEGSTGQTIALRSAIEVVAALFLAKGRNYIYEEVKQNCITNTKCCVK